MGSLVDETAFDLDGSTAMGEATEPDSWLRSNLSVLEDDSSTSSLDDSTSAGESTSEQVEVASLLRSSVGLSENVEACLNHDSRLKSA